MAELIKIIDCIRTGRFCPDVSRSGRINLENSGDKLAQVEIAGFDPTETRAVQSPLNSSPDPSPDSMLPCSSDPYHASNLNQPNDVSELCSSSGSDSGSGESSVSEEQAKVLRKVQLEVPEERESRIAYFHRISQLLHMKRTECSKLLCGRRLSESYSRYKWKDTAGLLQCSQCFR